MDAGCLARRRRSDWRPTYAVESSENQAGFGVAIQFRVKIVQAQRACESASTRSDRVGPLYRRGKTNWIARHVPREIYNDVRRCRTGRDLDRVEWITKAQRSAAGNESVALHPTVNVKRSA